MGQHLKLNFCCELAKGNQNLSPEKDSVSQQIKEKKKPRVNHLAEFHVEIGC